jgi:hypothetical protein
VHCLLDNERRQGFLELTPISAEQMLAQTPAGQPLRGWQFEAKRLSGDKARLNVRLRNPSRCSYSLPLPIDPESTLMRLWGWESKRTAVADDWEKSAPDGEYFPREGAES